MHNLCSTSEDAHQYSGGIFPAASGQQSSAPSARYKPYSSERPRHSANRAAVLNLARYVCAHLFAALLMLPGMALWGSPSAPKILVQPENQTAALGSAVTFNVTATGSDLVYYWWCNGVLMVQGPNSSYAISNVQSTNAGNYQVTIANQLGSLRTTVVTLKVVDAGQTSPSISAVPCQSVDKNTSLGPVSFTISGGTASGDDLMVRGLSSNTNLVPNENIR